MRINNTENLIITKALVEQHLHGGFGIDFATCDTDGFIEFSKKILKFGVCAFFPTLATDSVENLKRQIAQIKNAIQIQDCSDQPMAKIAGIHLEACFLNPAKKGIHNETQLLMPTIENYQLIEDDVIKIVTLAPELDENFELCKYLKANGVRVSAGHCIGADLSKVEQVTHLYNAMGEFSHRTPSTVISALSDDRVFVELIADLKHVQKEVVEFTFKTKPLDKIILISDALPIAKSDLEYMNFCGKTVFLKDGKATDSNGTMAGSTMFVSDIIKQLVKEGLCDLQTAVNMATINITHFEKTDAQIYWDENLNITAMSVNGNIIEF